MSLYCAHGFLGGPSDWDFLAGAGFNVAQRPFFFGAEHSSVPPLALFADTLRDSISSGTVLLGYSMGGRLIAEALARGARPSRAVLVSTGLGIESVEARSARRAADEAWARRFESDPWESVLADWNAQAVFGGHRVDRPESRYSRGALAAALREWSPGLQEPLAPRLNTVDVPTLWIAGARDAKYKAEAERGAALMPRGEVAILENAGHRVPWEAPEAFIATLRAFVDVR
jgi:2-succinyl-6-hydroxy-2,4-cyclohexadiene-1-carboxylate synthase